MFSKLFKDVRGNRILIGHIGYMFIGNSIVQMSNIISGIFIGRWIAPNDYGVWVGLNLLPSYLVWLQAGTANGLGRELPVTKGKEKNEESNSLISAALAFNLCAGIIAALVLIVIGMLGSSEKSDQWKLGIFFMAFNVFSMILNGLMFIIGRSNLFFRPLFIVSVIQSILQITLLIMVRYFGFFGLCWRLVITQTVVLFIYIIALRNFLSVKWNTKLLLRLFRVGVPIFFAGYAALLSSIADRTLVGLHLGSSYLGIYGFAVFVYSGMQGLSISMAEVIYPRMASHFGRTGNPHELWNYIKISIKLSMIILPIPLFLLWFMLPWLFKTLIPKYTDAVTPARILLISVLINSLSVGAGSLLNSIGWAWVNTLVLTVGVLTMWLLTYLFIVLGWGLTGVALANVISCTMLSFSLIIVALYGTKRIYAKGMINAE